MARGGARPGAGRKRGSANKSTKLQAAIAAAGGLMPLDIGLACMRELYARKKWSEALAGAAKLAPFFNQKFSPTDQPAKPHKDQGIIQRDLFDEPPKTAEPKAPHVGKKEQVQQAAETAGAGSDWGGDLTPPSSYQ